MCERAGTKGCMKSMARLLTVCAASFSALALPGCGGGNEGNNNFFGVFGFGGAEIRFLNGSPDTGAVDVAVGDPNRIVFSNVVYGSITAYVQYSDRSSPDVYVYQHNSQTLIGGHVQNDGNLATANVTLGVSTRDTIVLAGYNATASVAAIKFQEHIFGTDRSFGAVQFHQAATGLGTASIDAGYYAAASPAARTSLGTVVYGQPPLVTEPLPNPPTGTGIGFYVRGGQATVTPSQVDATDSANVMPVAGAAQFNDQNLSVYLIDSAAAPSYRLLAVFDPDN
jgi:hypothetical protein